MGAIFLGAPKPHPCWIPWVGCLEQCQKPTELGYQEPALLTVGFWGGAFSPAVQGAPLGPSMSGWDWLGSRPASVSCGAHP